MTLWRFDDAKIFSELLRFYREKMLFDDSDDDDELGIDVVTDWISQNPIFFYWFK